MQQYGGELQDFKTKWLIVPPSLPHSSLPFILGAYVVGVPDERFGEELCAWIKLKSSQENCSVDEIKAFCKQKLAHFKVPKYILFVDEFPTTVTGKIQKFKMREMSIEKLRINEK